MGYVKLRNLLMKYPGGISAAVAKTGINLNRFYNLTGKRFPVEEYPRTFTDEEKAIIMKELFADTEYDESEVFQIYADSDALYYQGLPSSNARKRFR